MPAEPFRVITADRSQPGLSRELQLGKAAEHVACADVMLQGFNAFLSDAGLPYDMLVDVGDGILRVQVKGSLAPYENRRRDGRISRGYRFGLRRGRAHDERIDAKSVDVVACVALDTRRVAYLHISELIKNGRVVGLVEVVDDTEERRWGSFTFGKLSRFPTQAPDRSAKECSRCTSRLPATPENFLPNKKCRDGLTGICRTCARKADTEKARARRAARKAAA